MTSPLPPLEALPIGALPPPLAALADPEIPLARSERFVPGERIPVGGAFVALLVGGAFGFGLFGAALFAWGTADDDPAGRYLAPILAAVAWARAAAGWLTLRRARAQRDAIDRGRWRRGLFVEDDGLLLVESGAEGPTGRWIPKRMVQGSRAHPTRPQLTELQLTEGDPIAVPGAAGALTRRLKQWQETGAFAWDEQL